MYYDLCHDISVRGGGIAVVHSGEVLEPPSSPGVNTSNLTEEASAS